MWVWRKTLKVHWTEKKKNSEILASVGETRTLMGTVINRKQKWAGHHLRSNCLLRDVLEGAIEGKGKRGRRRIKMLDCIKGGRSFWEMKNDAQDREAWRQRTDGKGT